jgi:hypothetical protein
MAARKCDDFAAQPELLVKNLEAAISTERAPYLLIGSERAQARAARDLIVKARPSVFSAFRPMN